MLHRNDALAIIMTFVFGFILGVYLYFSGFMAAFNTSEVPTLDELPAFVLEGDVYGGCQRAQTCPSFRIESDGSYRYLYTPAVGTDQIVRDGALPKSLRTEINRTFTDVTLQQQSTIITPALCESYGDGIDVRYTVMIGELSYKLDTCGTAVNVDSPLWQTLVKIWNYFETGEV